MTDTSANTCNAPWTDDLSDDYTVIHCDLPATHTGPHHNHNGTTWGGPTHWRLT